MRQYDELLQLVLWERTRAGFILILLKEELNLEIWIGKDQTTDKSVSNSCN